MIYINIAKDFTDTPGPRYISEGKYSGEEFRNDILVPKFEEAIKTNDKITIDLDGGFGYIDSFLEEVFGGLARKYNSKIVKEKIEIISNDQKSLLETINKYIEEANDDK